ncbi:Hypothetical predicted protein [Paramuricea clavata]|uniref:Uncharacterized protein n=1 Tax=Paramuricea clavata TaxID=317549 RepID=A0A7D9EG76_PARCT|nr:Hypothetical predicted protein [Paramuricea clavata]
MTMKYGYRVPIFISAAAFLISFFWAIVVNREKVDSVEVLIFCIFCGLDGMLTIALPVYFTKIQVKKFVCINRFSEWNHWFFLFFCSQLFRITIFSSGGHVEPRMKDTVLLSLIPSALILCGTDLVDHGFLPYCPAIVDIYDGIEMYYTKLNPTNPVWVQITICLAIIMFYIPSVLELYLLNFPELKYGSISSERKVKLCQFVCCCVFLVVRMMLYAYKPHEIIFAAKTFIRVYCHYKSWSNMNSAPQIVPIQVTEISTEFEKALSLVNESPSLHYMNTGKSGGKTQRCSEIPLTFSININITTYV